MSEDGPNADRVASPPPLLAYTASKQDQGGGKRGKVGGKSVRGKAKVKQAPARKFKKQAEPVLFDDKARREYLTGFRKRKQARIENSKQKAKERENEERRKARAEARKARKEQAAENVRMEKVAYGGDEDDSDDEEVGDDKQEAPSPSAFETEEHHTTVTVEAWDPNVEQELPTRKSETKNPLLKQKYQLPPSSRRAAKKAKSEEKAAGTGRNKRSVDTRELSRLMDAEDAELVVAEPTNWSTAGSASAGKLNENGKKGKFHYESKLERAKAKAKIREDKAKFAEKQKEKRKYQNILRRGGSKAKALMRGEI